MSEHGRNTLGDFGRRVDVDERPFHVLFVIFGQVPPRGDLIAAHMSLAPLASAVDDMVLVSDTQIINAMRAYFECERMVIEPAGAAALAAAMADAKSNVGKAITVIATGSNVDLNDYQERILK